jgi:ketosteroid isomerase-like protein
MSEATNQAVVEQVYAAFRRKDLPAILALQAEDAEWSVAASRELIPWASPGPGPAGVAEFLRVLAQWLVADVFEIRVLLVRDETVVALGFQRGTVRPTGTPYAFDFVHVWTLAAARVRSFRVYYDTAYVGAVLRADGADRSAAT